MLFKASKNYKIYWKLIEIRKSFNNNKYFTTNFPSDRFRLKENFDIQIVTRIVGTIQYSAKENDANLYIYYGKSLFVVKFTHFKEGFWNEEEEKTQNIRSKNDFFIKKVEKKNLGASFAIFKWDENSR